MTGNGKGILNLPVEMVALSNGIRCLLRPQAHNDIVALLVLLDITVFDESDKHIGLANLAQRLLRKGTAKRSAQQVAESLESLGASLGSSMSEDLALVSLQVAKDDLAKALPLMAEVLWEPAFSPEEVSRERDQVLAELRLRDDDPFALVHRHFRRALYGNHPYGRMVEGTAESVARLNTGLCRQWHRRMFTPANALVVGVGNFDPKELLRLLNRHLGKRGAAEPRETVDRLRPLGTYRPRRASLSRPLEQSVCLVGWPGPSIEKIEDAAAMKVAAAVLGAGMSSRLFQELRDKQGLAYSVGCSFSLRRSTSHLLAHIGTKPETASHATRQIVSEIQSLGKKPLPDSEIDRAKVYLRGTHLSDHQTNARQAWHLGWGQLTGLGHGFDAKWPSMIEAVTPADIMRVVRRCCTTPTIVTLKSQRH